MKKIVTNIPRHSEIIEVPMREIKDNEILIRLKYVGVCMSEHYAWCHAKNSSFGHEPMGIVEKVGKNVTDYKVGDRVSGLWGDTLPGGGGMSEYAVAVQGGSVFVLPDNVPDEDLILEPLACMISAVSKAKVNLPGMEVCVVGCGYMGCGAISLLKMRGAIVHAVDIRPESRENAKKYGGADYVYSVEEAQKMLADGFEGFEVVMEWGETDESLDLAIHLTKQCGQLCIGAYHTGASRAVNMQLLNVRAIDCLSTHPRELDLTRRCAELAAKLLSEGRWNYRGLPTMIYPMDQFDRAQAEMDTKYGHHMKALIDMTKLTGEAVLING